MSNVIQICLSELWTLTCISPWSASTIRGRSSWRTKSRSAFLVSNLIFAFLMNCSSNRGLIWFLLLWWELLLWASRELLLRTWWKLLLSWRKLLIFRLAAKILSRLVLLEFLLTAYVLLLLVLSLRFLRWHGIICFLYY